VNRILWNERGGSIDEVVMSDCMVHVEQMDDRCWWIGIQRADGGYWAGNFHCDSRGRMQFTEQDMHGFEWEDDDSHDEPVNRTEPSVAPEFSGEGVGSKIGETDSNRPTAGRNAGTDPTVPDVFALALPPGCRLPNCPDVAAAVAEGSPLCAGCPGDSNDPPTDVFALAVPCPHTRRNGPTGGTYDHRFEDCPEWVHHGDYRVLEVLPIRGDGRGQPWPGPHVEVIGNGSWLWTSTDSGDCTQIDLPGAVPGGVALIVERVEP
jgi:hypothetical protein